MAAAVVAAPLAILPITAAQAADVDILSSDFETSPTPWYGRGAAQVALTDVGHESASSLLVTGRTANWHGAEVPIFDLLVPGEEYTVTAWVRLADGEEDDRLKFSVAEQPEDYIQVTDPEAALITDDAWTQVSGTYTLADDVTSAALYVEATGADTEFLVDDVVINGPEAPTDGGETPAEPTSPVVAPVSAARGTGNVSALTFDDGPNGDTTAELLDFLAAEDIQATFCVIGENIEKPGGAELLQRMVDEGHVLCNHSTGYADLGSASAADVEADLRENLDIIREALGDPTAPVPFFRAPNGNWGATPAVAVRLGMQPLAVTNMINDWATQDLDTLTTNLRASMKPGEIVLVHDGGGDRTNSVAAVRTVVTERLAAGWEFTLPVGADATGIPGEPTEPTEPTEPVADPGLSNDFETGLGAWGVRGEGGDAQAVAALDADGRNGSQAALVSGRTNAWNGLQADVTDVLQAGASYRVSAWVKMAADASAADVNLSQQLEAAGATTYSQVATATSVQSGTWQQISATYTAPSSADQLLLYFETAAGTSSFLVDDIVVTAVNPGDETPVQLDIPSLNNLEDPLPWPIGVAIDARETSGQGEVLVTKHFDQFTAENAMKPEAIQPTEGEFNFAGADELVDFAVENDLDVYGHTLVWHSQTPEWFFNDADGVPLTNSAEDRAILSARMKTHIDTIAEHYRTKYGEFGTAGNPIVAFDVVNEVIDESQSDGMRRSRWFEVLGEDFIHLAFEYASDAFNNGVVGGPVTLFINDYNTELPGKRQAMVNLVERLLESDVPVDGMGHQFHVSLATPIAQMKASIDAFAETGLVQVVTELDVGINGAATPERLVQQGYYYADLFDMLREYPDLFSVTLWGPDDARTWRTGEAPLVFDEERQAKPAFWGIADRSQLPALTRQVVTHQADLTVEPGVVDDIEWALLPLTQIASSDAGTTGFQLRWDEGRLVAYVQVQDATDDGAADTVTLFAGDTSLEVARDGSTVGTEVVSTETGYTVVAELIVEGITRDSTVPFDVRIADGGTGELVSWNDLTHNQEDGSALGTAVLVEPVGYVAIPRAEGDVTIDGVIDDAWAGAAVVSTDTQVEGEAEGGATATVRTLWTEGVLHMLFEVTDDELDKSAIDAYLQDSVEFFVDPSNAKSGPLNPEDGHYRVNFDNEQSFGGDPSVIGDNLTSATAVTDTGYIVEASVLLTEPEALALAAVGDEAPFIGVEFQVNDATPGNTARTSVRSWSDPTGRSYQDTSRWGVGQLVDSIVPTDPTVPVDPTDPVVVPPADGPSGDGQPNAGEQPTGPKAPGTTAAPRSGALAITGAELAGALLALAMLVGAGTALVWYRRRGVDGV